MILYPAIDLKDGQAVRLVHGDMDKTTVFNDDPAAQAKAHGLGQRHPRAHRSHLIQATAMRG